MTREEVFANCPLNSFVEYYCDQWLIIPFTVVKRSTPSVGNEIGQRLPE
jgi:hypothetical protein